MNAVEKDILERRLAEQALFKETLELKNARLEELESEVRYLRRLLNEMLAAPRPAAAPAPKREQALPREGIPSRWRV